MNRQQHRVPVNTEWRPAHGGLVIACVLLLGLGWGLTAHGRTLTFKLGVDRESLTGTGTVTGVYYWSSPTNWTDEAGAMALPVDGDYLYLNVKPSTRSACRFDDYKNAAFRPWQAEAVIPYMTAIHFGPNANYHNVSDCGFRLRTLEQGGEGVITEVTQNQAFWLPLYLRAGTTRVDVRNAAVSAGFTTFKGVSASDAGRILKTGAGILSGNSGTWWKGATVREGTFRLSASATAPSGQEWCFDGSAASAYLNLGTNTFILPNGWLHTTNAIPATAHGVTGTAPACLRITGTPPVDESFCAAGFHGGASFTWQPDAATKTFRFSRAVNTSTGTFAVANGTLRFSDGAQALSLAKLSVAGANARVAADAGAYLALRAGTLEVADGGKLVLGTGARMGFGAASTNGAAVTAPAYFTGPTGTYGQPVDWIEGDGFVFVSGAPVATDAATWTGAADTALTNAANWEVAAGSALDFASGGLVATFASSGSAAHLTDAYRQGFYGIRLSQSFSFTAAEDARVTLGAGGLASTTAADDATAHTFEMGWPLVLTAGQTWNVVGSNDVLDVTAPIDSLTSDTLVKSGAGTLNLRADNTFRNPLKISAGVVRVYADGAFGSASSGTVLDLKQTKIVFHGVTCPEPFTVSTLASNFRTPAGVTNVFTGLVDFRYGSNSISCWGDSDTSTFIFRGGLMNNGNFGMGNKGTLIVEDVPMKLEDRVSMAYGTVLDLRVAHNVIGVNHYLFHGSTLYTRVPYALYYDAASSFTHTCIRMGLNGPSLWDMCGCDQSLMEMVHRPDYRGEIRSATACTLHHQFMARRAKETDGYYAVTNYVLFTGGVSYSYEGADSQKFRLMREQTSTGTVSVASGLLEFAPTASWAQAPAVNVTGGTLKVENATAFGRGAELHLASDAGTVDLAYAGTMKMHTLYIGGVRQRLGVYGGADTSARYRPRTDAGAYRFTGTGTIHFIGDGLGTSLIVR